MADLLVDDGGLLDLVLADSDHVFALLPRGLANMSPVIRDSSYNSSGEVVSRFQAAHHAPPDECARLPRRQNLKVWGYTRVGTWMAAASAPAGAAAAPGARGAPAAGAAAVVVAACALTTRIARSTRRSPRGRLHSRRSARQSRKPKSVAPAAG
eukprot:scaffold1890_cov380-Prasinococcus_capsulatus_cf.AAC.13